MALVEPARALIRSGAYGHLVTLGDDGAPHVTMAWFDVDEAGTELAFATLFDQRKLVDLRRDPRAVVSFEADHVDGHGLRPYLVVHGLARVEEGGAPELLQHLAHTFLGPDVVFPPMPDPPPGFVTRIRVDRVGGVGPWGG